MTDPGDAPTGPTPLHVDMDEMVYATRDADPQDAAGMLAGITVDMSGSHLGRFVPKHQWTPAQWIEKHNDAMSRKGE